MKERLLYWLKVLGVFASLAFLWWVWASFNGTSFNEAFFNNWGISLPEGEDVYVCTTPPDFLGDGDRYRIIGYGEDSHLSQVVDWRPCDDDQAVQDVQKLWLALEPNEEYLPEAIRRPYGYYQASKNGGTDRLVMIYTAEAILGGNRYRNVIFYSETHS